MLILINVGNSCTALYFLGPVIFLINKKLKRTVFIQNRDFVLQYTLLFKSLGSANVFFLSFFKETFKKFKES